MDAVRAWAAAGEDEGMEFKATTGQRDEAGRALCGMLNGLGGRVIFGIAPDGVAKGQQVVDKTLEDLAASFKHLQPETHPRINRVALEGDAAAIVVTVEAGTNKPYTYRGSPYRRVGATTQKMSSHEQQILLLEQVHQSTRWEDKPALIDIGDLDLRELTTQVEVGQQRGRIGEVTTNDPRNILLALGLWHPVERPTHAAAVLFGNRQALQHHYPQCVARLSAFQGTSEADPFDEIAVEHDHVFGLLTIIERFVRGHLRIRSELHDDSFYRTDTPEIPAIAIREAILNALAHREYHHHGGSVTIRVFDDRLQVISNGKLHFGLRPELLYRPHSTQPWNPHIASMIYRAGLVDTMGTGTIRMVQQVRSHGLPIPIIEDDQLSVTVTFTRPGWPSPLLKDVGLTRDQLQILEEIASRHPNAARADLVTATDLADRVVRLALDDLRAAGLARYHGSGRGARWQLTGPAARAYGHE